MCIARGDGVQRVVVVHSDLGTAMKEFGIKCMCPYTYLYREHPAGTSAHAPGAGPDGATAPRFDRALLASDAVAGESAPVLPSALTLWRQYSS